jgi:hypothetical protein
MLLLLFCVQVVANDIDNLANGLVFYTKTGVSKGINAAGEFSINSVSGDIMATGTYAVGEVYTVGVRASDSADPEYSRQYVHLL